MVRSALRSVFALSFAMVASPNTSLAGLCGAAAGKLVLGRRADWIVPIQTTEHAASADGSKKAAIESYLRHAYTVYFGLRACTELSVEQNDNSFRPSVSLEESRRTLKSIDAAAAEVLVDANAVWAAAAPRAEVTAEALKTDPAKYVEHCHKMGSLFRVDVSNLQPLLQSLGAKTTILTKDY